MLPDYEIKKTASKIDRIMPYIEFVLILIIIQGVIGLFAESETEEAIRFRLLAHSNTNADQMIKEEIQQKIEPLIETAVAASQSKKELGDNLAALEKTIIEIATSIAPNMSVTLERKEALFPAKRSSLVIHPQAKYDAYILTIGSGRGDNWWCAMFPKICFPDKKKDDEEKVTFFVWEWIKGLFA